MSIFRRKLTREQREREIPERYRRGETLYSLSYEYVVSPCTIRKALVKAGVKLRRPGPVGVLG